MKHNLSSLESGRTPASGDAEDQQDSGNPTSHCVRASYRVQYPGGVSDFGLNRLCRLNRSGSGYSRSKKSAGFPARFTAGFGKEGGFPKKVNRSEQIKRSQQKSCNKLSDADDRVAEVELKVVTFFPAIASDRAPAKASDCCR